MTIMVASLVRAACIGVPFAFSTLVACGQAPQPHVPEPMTAAAPACSALAPGTVRLLLSLKQSIFIEAYVARGTSKLDAFVQELERVLVELERVGNGRLSFGIIQAKTDQQRHAAKDAGLKEQTFGENQAGYMGLAFQYGGQKDCFPALSPDQLEGLEFRIARIIRDLRDQVEGIHRRIGVVSGKDELDIKVPELVVGNPNAPSMQGIVTRNFPFLQFETVDLRGGASAIDGGLQALIITQPGQDFSEPELKRIDEFVMKGKGLAVFASAVNLRPADASMKASMSTHGLGQLLQGYGIEMASEVVLDWNRQRIPIVDEKRGTLSWISAPGLAVPKHTPGLRASEQTLDTSFPGFVGLDELAFPFPSGLIIRPQAQPRVKFTTIARTTPGATAVSDDTDFRPPRNAKPVPPFGVRDVAVALEGMLISSMSGDKGDGSKSLGQSTRVVVVSSSSFLANPYVRAGKAVGNAPGDEMLQMISMPYARHYLTTTILAFKGILDWLTADREMADPAARLATKCAR